MHELIERLEDYGTRYADIHGRRLRVIDDAIAALKAKSKEDIYGYELDKVAEVLTKLHPIGKVKAIGRMEAAQAMLEVFKNFPAWHDRPTCAGLWVCVYEEIPPHVVKFTDTMIASGMNIGGVVRVFGPIPTDPGGK